MKDGISILCNGKYQGIFPLKGERHSNMSPICNAITPLGVGTNRLTDTPNAPRSIHVAQ